ncbi:MAG TPA: hypothetical protein VKB78_12475, partial [Pirellulales bacterium]|nr:hypothetical protein [Pirellulales bacterium]
MIRSASPRLRKKGTSESPPVDESDQDAADDAANGRADAETNGAADGPEVSNGDAEHVAIPLSSGEGARSHHRRRRATAQSMAAAQRDISVSEFFAKNRHLLGFDNPRKALLTTVKEAVDNSLDACEEAGI